MTMNDRLKELTATRAKLAALESSIAAERNAALATLPAQYGFAEVNAFIAAVRAAGGKRRGRKPKAAKAAVAPKPGKARRTRAVITDATRGEVSKLVEAGKTGAQIAAALKISLPSVHNIKTALGLIKKPRKAKKK